ncbi:MAG: FAD-binding oxidoreductase [Aeromicrobium sp.]
MTTVGPTAWQVATVAEIAHPAPGFVRIRLDVPDRLPSLPGQHYVVRLRAEDGYTAQRSYSVASDPEDPQIELLVEQMPDGEVSGHLHDVLEFGDQLEVRGPIGRWFTWRGEEPAVAMAGGSGLVPIISMMRWATLHDRGDDLRVIAVGRTWELLPYADELAAYGAFIALTQENRIDDHGTERVSAPPYPDEVAPLVDGTRRAYVCGSVGFVGYASRLLAESGVRADTVRVEQFGATG